MSDETGLQQRTPRVGPVETETNENVPLYTHTYVLGVDIHVHQRGYVKGGEVDRIEAYGNEVEPPLGQRCRRDLAAWARRNLFGGASPDV